MKNAELIVIPFPATGHIGSTIETAKRLVDRDERISISILILKMPIETKLNSYIEDDPTARIRVVHLPHPTDGPTQPVGRSLSSFFNFIENQKPSVRTAVADLIHSSSSTPHRRIAGFMIDLFLTTTMKDVADEFGVPTYAYSTSSAAYLGLLLHLQILQDHQNLDVTTEFLKEDSVDHQELSIPSFGNPVPAKLIPLEPLDKEGGGARILLANARRVRETKGILINTFIELETHAIKSLLSEGYSLNHGGLPPIYPVGPVVINQIKEHQHHEAEDDEEVGKIFKWLDDQPPSSVLFLCFGSMGSFKEEQIQEIATALERSRVRFLWSLRRPPLKLPRALESPGEYRDPACEVVDQLEGFVAWAETERVGKVIGWAPQMAVLSHPAVGGFVSHCGWNSIMESLWCGVPLATWPVYTEQQLNAFQMVKELGIAVEIRMDYRMDYTRNGRDFEAVIVRAEEIEKGIRRLMMMTVDDEDVNVGGTGDVTSEVRKKMEEMRNKGRVALEEGGSSYASIARFIQDVVDNITVAGH